MRARSEYIKNAADNILRYYEKEASVGERMSANFSELAAFVAAATARDIRTRGSFGGDIPFADYMPTVSTESAAEAVLPENAALIGAKLAADEGAYLADFCRKTTAALRTAAKLRPSPALFAERESRCGNSRNKT